MDAIMRRRQMMMVGEPPAPPVMIPYVRGGGDGSYIDTGITPDPTTKVIVWARNWNPGYSYFNWVYFYVHTEDVTLSGFNPTVKIIAKKDNVCVFQYKYNTILKDIFVGDKRVYEVIANN